MRTNRLAYRLNHAHATTMPKTQTMDGAALAAVEALADEGGYEIVEAE